jgi:DNA primase
VIENSLRDRNLHRPAEKAEAVEEVLPYIRAVNSRIQKREYFDMAMDGLRITDPALRRELWQSVRDKTNYRAPAPASLTKHRQATAAEQRLLGLLFADESLRRRVLPMLNDKDYEDLPTAPLFKALIELDRDGSAIDFDTVNAKTEGDEFIQSMIPMVLLNSSLHGSNEHYVPEECVSTFRLMKIEQRIEELRAELALAERNQDNDRISQLVNEQIELSARRQIMLQRTEAAHNNGK